MQLPYTGKALSDADTERWLTTYFDSISPPLSADVDFIPKPTYSLYGFKRLNDSVVSVIANMEDHLVCSRKILWVFNGAKPFNTEMELERNCDIEQSQTGYATVGFSTNDTLTFLVTNYKYSAPANAVNEHGEFSQGYTFDNVEWEVDSSRVTFIRVEAKGTILSTID
jgi:hypothetical protein